jgi:hypothetical protein
MLIPSTFRRLSLVFIFSAAILSASVSCNAEPDKQAVSDITMSEAGLEKKFEVGDVVFKSDLIPPAIEVKSTTDRWTNNKEIVADESGNEPLWQPKKPPVLYQTDRPGFFDRRSPAVMFLVIEGIVIVDAGLATGNPTIYGLFMGLVGPIAAGGNGNLKNPVGIAINLAAIEAYAIYNTQLYSNSKNEIFRKNIIGLNLVGVVLAGTDYFFKEKSSSKYSYSITPMKSGGYAQVSYQF